MERPYFCHGFKGFNLWALGLFAERPVVAVMVHATPAIIKKGDRDERQSPTVLLSVLSLDHVP